MGQLKSTQILTQDTRNSHYSYVHSNKYFDIQFPVSHLTLHGIETFSILATQSEGQRPVASALSRAC